MVTDKSEYSEPGMGDPDSSQVHWPRVKEILDGAIAGWKARNGGREPRLALRHGGSFGWSTKEQLMAAAAVGFRLIDPEKVGKGQGAQANLIIALRDEEGVQGNGRMPNGGPFLPDSQIDEIVHWIDLGMPD